MSKSPNAPSTPEKPLTLGERWYLDKRVGGQLRFAISISLLNILGQPWLGFEQPWITPFVALSAAYFTELTAEYVQS